MSLDKYIIQSNENILETLKKINYNKKGFLIVVDDEKAIGTITDGDLRRAFIEGKNIYDIVGKICKSEFKYVGKEKFFDNVIELFKDDSVEFLPVLDEERRLINIVTKKQIHSLLLQNKNFGYDYNFETIQESLLDYEIYNRPWGFYKTTVLNEFFQSKIISVNPLSSLSLQLHNHREEHWIVVHGEGIVMLCDSEKKIQSGDYVFIPKGCKHRLINISNEEQLLLTEVQIGDYFGEDDIIRLDDEYGRT